jgi:hypothetical protein
MPIVGIVAKILMAPSGESWREQKLIGTIQISEINRIAILCSFTLTPNYVDRIESIQNIKKQNEYTNPLTIRYSI